MKITIRPDPNCIELISKQYKFGPITSFLVSIGVPEKESNNWESTHTVEINENDPPLVYVFNMRCYLPDELFAKTEWIFKFAKEELFTSFIISGHAVCFLLSNTAGLKYLPKNLLNLCLDNYQVETLNDDFQELKNLPNFKSISFYRCNKLKDIPLLKNLINLQALDLSGCKALKDINFLSGLSNLQTLSLYNCETLTDINGLSGLINLRTLDLSRCSSLTDLRGLSGWKWWKLIISKTQNGGLSSLVKLQSLNLSHCESLTDISGLSGLTNLRTLNLSECKSLTDISGLSGLTNLRTLNLSECKSLTDISGLSGLVNLQSLDLSSCSSLTDISSLYGLLNLQTLDLGFCGSGINIDGSRNTSWKWWKSIISKTQNGGLSSLINLQSLDLSSCTSLTDLNVLSGLLNLQSLNLSWCPPKTDISGLSGLLNLRTLDLSCCGSLTDINSLSGLVNLKTLDFSSCGSLTDIGILSTLVNLNSLNLRYCELLTDISGLAGLVNLQNLDLRKCVFLTNLSGLSGLINLQTLFLGDCKRIKSFSPLRKCLALKELDESMIHPVEHAELLCFLAVQRKDIPYISKKADSWLNELEMGFDQKHSSTNDLACSLAEGIVLANLEEVELSFHQTLLNQPNVMLSPWKIWFSENLKTYGWNKIRKLAELNKPSELTFGAIAGISSCLPSLEGDPAQIAWAKKLISEIHSLHNTNPSFLKPAAAEWCLVLKRLGEDEFLREWIEKFTDPSDPSALDPINKVFSAYALDLNDSESALEYALKINDPKLRDKSILNLALQIIKEGEITKVGEFLFLLTQIESRTQLAFSLAEDVAYLKSDENSHRLLAACGDSPKSLACILDKLRLANPASEILKIMHEKLSDESRSEIPIATIVKECNSLAEFLIHTKDSSQLVRIHQAIDSVVKSS